MNNSVFSWLHISDIHLKADKPYDQDVVLRSFLESLPELLNRYGKPDCIVVSGDIADKGSKEEYDKATGFFDKILSVTGLKRFDLIVIPGNHDVDRKSGRGLKRTIASRDEADDYFNQTDTIPHIIERQHNFLSWFDEYFCGIRTFDRNTTVSCSVVFERGDTRFLFVPINTATFCIGDDDHSNLFIGRRSLEQALRKIDWKGDEVTIAVMHHPVTWMSALEQANIKARINEKFDFILSGHLHTTDIEQTVSLTGSSVHLAAGALYQTRKWPNTAMLCKVEDNDYTIYPFRYEDNPLEIWTIDPSIFPKSEGFFRRKAFVRSNYPSKIVIKALLSDNEDAPPKEMSAAHQGLSASKAFEQDLFVTPAGTRLYVEPRIMDRPQEFSEVQDTIANPVTINEIINSDLSYVIVAKTEYGGTSLCGRLAYEFSLISKTAIIKDARNLPNYKAKLEKLFSVEIESAVRPILILDNFDVERDERLIKELSNSLWFSQIILIAIDRSLRAASFTEINTKEIKFIELHLWSIARGGVRLLAAALFKTNDEEYVSRIVDKVYGDLLGMIIPLTPANVIMYLRILHSEGEFNPINHVEIVERYLEQLLRKPSDAYGEGLNLKNKMEILSALAYSLYQRNESDFSDESFHSFIQEYKNRALLDVNSAELLSELIEARIIVRWGSSLFMKYAFFFSYFLGKYIYCRQNILSQFLIEEHYLTLPGVIDVITGLSSDNELVLDTLVTKLELHLSEFSRLYIKGAFDPLKEARWLEHKDEAEKLWEPISKQLETGPASTREIDLIKTSLQSEARTVDQSVSYVKFTELEHTLFIVCNRVVDALKKSDDVNGIVKLRALDAVFKAHTVAFQVGSIFWEVLARSRYVQWGALVFVNFNDINNSKEKTSGEINADAAETPQENNETLVPAVVTSLCRVVAKAAAEKLGTRKLGPLFHARRKSHLDVGFFNLINFNCIIMAKSPGWYEEARRIIIAIDKDSFYLYAVLNSLMRSIKTDVTKQKDLASLKNLVAIIQSKRVKRKNDPGEKLIASVLDAMDKSNFFKEKPII